MANMTKIDRMSPSDERAIKQLLRIYQSSIEPSEQKSTSELIALVKDPRYHILVSRDGENITGFAMAFVPEHPQFVLLEYMAVDNSLRSRGIGATLLDAAKEVAAECNAPLLLEVDQPGNAVSPNNDPARRVRFYAERGCKRIANLDYILPLDANGTPPPMWLLVSGHARSLSRDEMREWLIALYVEVYHRDAGDPRIEMMLAKSGRQHFALSPIM